MKIIKDKYLPKDIELKAKIICESLGAELIETKKDSKAHQVEVFWGEKTVCDYLYIDRKRGFNTAKNDLQVVIHPEVNDLFANELISVDGIKSPNDKGAGKLIHSSQYKGFKNRKVGGEYVGVAWRLDLSSDLINFHKFLSIVMNKGKESSGDKEISSDYKSGEYTEGSKYEVTLTKNERSSSARKKCIEHHGVRCLSCSFDFQEVYGPIGEGFIHIHHIVPLEDITEAYTVDPINDLIPLCPNCHAMAHKRKPPYNLFELQSFIREKL